MVANSEWYSMFPFVEVENKVWTESDHFPLILTTEDNNGRGRRRPKRFYFEAIWTKNPACRRLVWKAWQNNSLSSFNQRLKKVEAELTRWHSINIGELNRKIKRLQEQLTMLKESPPTDDVLQEEKHIETLLTQAIKEEELYWSKRSRELWLKEGDKNTAYYMAHASERRKKNEIKRIKDMNGQWVEGLENVQSVAVQYFEELFRNGRTDDMGEVLQHVNQSITPEMNEYLSQDFTKEEVYNALFQMHPSKAPGPDGMSAMFYQHYWDIVGEDIIRTALEILNNNRDVAEFNDTNIVLIPKIDSPTNMVQYRPISLCNVSYKVVSKAISNRMKEVLPFCISESQSAFIKGRLITDNVMVAYEVMHDLNGRKTGNKKNFALKLDMSKAYDRVEWGFLGKMMEKMGFMEQWIRKIMNCITSVSFSVLINGERSRTFKPSRGLRQGDPLSPFLFVICAEGLSAMLKNQQQTSDDLGVDIGLNGPKVSHLFFADDSILFAKATVSGATKIKDLLAIYERSSGQRVNYDKSGLFFSPNTDAVTQVQIQELFGIDSSTNFQKYLGLPTLIGRDKKRSFKSMVDRVRKLVKGWSKKLLSIGGREVFIKAVLQAVPTYTMQCFLLPKSLCNEISRVIRRFWWNHKENRRGICWLSWKKICTPKALGGVGFRDLHLFNKAMIAKQWWRLMTNTETLSYKVMKARYFPNCSFIEAAKGSKPSYLWRSIWGSKEVFEKGAIWRIGDGSKTRIFKDNWLPEINNMKVKTERRNLGPNAKVEQLLMPNRCEWNEPLIRREFNQFEAQTILNIPLFQNMSSDQLTWSRTGNGRYTVKSGYYCLLESELEFGPHRNIWKKIWNSGVAPKIKLCLWKLCNNILPTGTIIQKRISTATTACPRCQHPFEDPIHAIRDCPIAKNTLKECGFHQGIIEEESIDPITWLENASGVLNTKDFDLLLTAIWVIWSARNTQVHRGIIDSDIRLAAKTKMYYDEYNAVQDKQDLRRVNASNTGTVKWKAPEEGWQKVNFDASFDDRTKTGGVGVVIRDSDGFVLASAAVKIHRVMDATIAMQVTQLIGHRKIILEGDALSVIKEIHSPEECFTRFGPLIEDCKKMGSQCEEFRATFTKRDGNKVAHSLARLSCSLQCDMYWTQEYPSTVHHIVMNDAINI